MRKASALIATVASMFVSLQASAHLGVTECYSKDKGELILKFNRTLENLKDGENILGQVNVTTKVLNVKVTQEKEVFYLSAISPVGKHVALSAYIFPHLKLANVQIFHGNYEIEDLELSCLSR